MGGAGLAALGFWLFLAAVVVAGIWYDAREKETKQETLRRIVESGHSIEPAVIERILGEHQASTADRDLKIAAYITLAASPGFLFLGFAISGGDGAALSALMGVAGLAFFVGVGLYLAAKLAERYKNDSAA